MNSQRKGLMKISEFFILDLDFNASFELKISKTKFEDSDESTVESGALGEENGEVLVTRTDH